MDLTFEGGRRLVAAVGEMSARNPDRGAVAMQGDLA
jgi:hypothetical protein